MAKCELCGEEYSDYESHMRRRHSIDCEEVKTKFLGFIGRVFNEGTNLMISHHIKGCESCSEDHDAITGVRRQALG